MITRRGAILSGSGAAGWLGVGATLPVLGACQPATNAVVHAATTPGAPAAIIATVANVVEIAANAFSMFSVGDTMLKRNKNDQIEIELVEAVGDAADTVGEVADGQVQRAGSGQGHPGLRTNPAASLASGLDRSRGAVGRSNVQTIQVDHILMPMSVDPRTFAARVRFDGIPTLPGHATPLSAAWVAPVLWGVDGRPYYGSWIAIGAEEWGHPFKLHGLDEAFMEMLRQPGMYRQGWAIRDYGDVESVLGVGSILEMLTDDQWYSETFMARVDVEDRPAELEIPSYSIATADDAVLRALAGA